MNTPKEIFAEARISGNIAVKDGVDGYPCGFAYLNIRPARGPFVKFLKANNIGRPDSSIGGYSLSSYDCCSFLGQNMDVKENGVRAFNDVLKQNGITASVYTRMD